MKPFYQGKLDVFCAMYAVLNGLQLTHGLRTVRARDILHETLMALAMNPESLRAVLEQRTDYLALVDGMLHTQAHTWPLDIHIPFQGAAHAPTPHTFWQTCQDFMHGGHNRTILFRFLRFMFADAAPLNRHWTAVEWIRGNTLHLFDCSHEAAAVLNFSPDSFVTRPEDVSPECLLCVEPRTVRFIAAK